MIGDRSAIARSRDRRFPELVVRLEPYQGRV